MNYYDEINKKLPNQTFVNEDEETKRKLIQLDLERWAKRVNSVDLLYADAISMGGWEFFKAFKEGEISRDFFVSIVKALRKSTAIRDSKLIRAVITTSAVAAIGGNKAKKPIQKIDEALNEEAYGD